MGTFLGLVLPVVLPTLITEVHKIFADTPENNPVKQTTVLDMLRALLTGMVNNKLPVVAGSETAQPTDDTLRGVIDTVYASLKAANKLPLAPGEVAVPGAAKPASLTPTGTLFLVKGVVQDLSSLQ